MSSHLWPLLRLEAENEDALKEAYRLVYLETYVRAKDGRRVEIYDWLGNRIFFHAGTFEHAFSESDNYRFSYGIHQHFSVRRARCMLWIHEVLAASKGTIERRHQMRKDSRGRLKKRRALIVVEEKYVVVLEERKKRGEFDFVTAFSADFAYLEKLRRESALLEIKKPQS